MTELIEEIRQCRLCEERLLLGPRPVLQYSQGAKILVAGQAPGTKVHQTGIPFNDPSGDRLRQWMGIDRSIFYDADQINIIPMGFCYPGRLPKGGDLPPDPLCAQTWHDQIFASRPAYDLVLVIGQYAQAYHLKGRMEKTLTQTVEKWQTFTPFYLPMPHPSPRNRFWLSKNSWFEETVVPYLQMRVKNILGN